MTVEPVPTPSAPPVAGPYAPAVRAGDWLVLAGQLGMEPGTGRLAVGTRAQAEQAMRNIEAILRDCGASMRDVAKTTVFVTDLGDFAAVNDVYGAAFADHRPARSTVQVAALPGGARVEVEVWAYVPRGIG
jgi:2-iminobutanoate/2-iminopropanoate deaminase